MSTTIEWTQRPGTKGETWNPTTGCNKVDRGCKNCYAEIMHKRLRAMGIPKYDHAFLDGAFSHESSLDLPFKWKTPRTVFVNSMSDLFHEDVEFDFICQVFQTIQLTPQHTYLILTKRPEVAIMFWHWMGLKNGQEWTPPDNVWMGTSANDQASAEKRIPLLLKLTGCLLFLSYEPATGPVDLQEYLYTRFTMGGNRHERNQLDWVIAGGESGPKADPSNPVWFCKVRDDCKAAGVPFFFKQWGLWHPLRDGSVQGGETNRVRRWFDGEREPMYKSNKKGYNILQGETYQEFPEPKKSVTFT